MSVREMPFLQRSDETGSIDADHAIKRLRSILATHSSTPDCELVSQISLRIVANVGDREFRQHSELLNAACKYLFEVGESGLGISLAKIVASKAEAFGDLPAHRRVANIIGAQYCDIADYAESMRYLEKAITLARRMESPLLEATCLANVVAVLQEMGHYQMAMTMADRVDGIVCDSPADASASNNLKLQCASIGLFAAHRTGDVKSAAKFLQRGQRYLDSNTEPLRRAFFEKNRVLYLVDLGDLVEAKARLNETLDALRSTSTPKIRILTLIASAVCAWASGKQAEAREMLENLYRESRSSKFYHHFVLQALIKVFGNAATPHGVAKGMDYARELVEYTTSVKKAKFYRQLANKRDAKDAGSVDSATATVIDPFETARAWLSTSEIDGPSDTADFPEKRHLTKHEELTVIHEDMAKLRAVSLRRDIRTDAVDTAENWAIAAEFFDDETGQHCYRVGHLASMLAREIGMNETFCIQIEHAARLHDIGKIAVNEVILMKPGPLDAGEMAAMRLHTEVGAQILSGSDDPTLKMATDVARHHHEWWNGAGYPTKRVGKETPLSARVCAYADVYDALTHVRAYKKAWTHERALDEIVRLKGVQFDPDLLDPFMAVLERYRADLDARAIPGFADMDSNALIASRKKLMETISAGSR